MDPLRPLSAPSAPQYRRPVASATGESAAPPPDRLAPFRDYAREQRLQEGEFLESVGRILDDPAPRPPRADRAEALLRLLKAFPPTPGRTLLGSSHADVLTSIDDLLAPPKNEVEREGMTITAYVSSFREKDTLEVKYRRADEPVASYLEAVDDYIDLSRRVGEGFGKRPGDLGEVRYGGISALQVVYQHLYREPVMTGLFREFLPDVGRSDHALHLARVSKDSTPEARRELGATFRAVKAESQSTDEAWRCLRLAMDVRQPGEPLEPLALDLHEAWSAGTRDAVALNKRYQGLTLPKIEPLVLKVAEERKPGEAVAPRVRRLLEDYFLTGSYDAEGTLKGAFDQGFPQGSVPDDQRAGLEDRFRRSVEERRLRGVKPEEAFALSLEDLRLLAAPPPAAPGRIEDTGRTVRIGDIELPVRPDPSA